MARNVAVWIAGNETSKRAERGRQWRSMLWRARRAVAPGAEARGAQPQLIALGGRTPRRGHGRARGARRRGRSDQARRSHVIAERKATRVRLPPRSERDCRRRHVTARFGRANGMCACAYSDATSRPFLYYNISYYSSYFISVLK